MAENTIVLKCGCDSPDQDLIYGKGRRLHNKGFKGSKELGKAYCTVCCHINRTVRISFKIDKAKGFGPLDKDPTIQRIGKNYEPKKGKPDNVPAAKVESATATVVKSSAPVRKDKEATANKKAKAN